ncbi:hypothetical protein [Endozoicomonas atrinae]|uniref:hypothetical protein n=1 Tax=Endozoicomonas atrinae TaxID=1333660 RepID=UPI0008247E5D|nr:hypothetical protein [Endozoicomonas atrinae]
MSFHNVDEPLIEAKAVFILDTARWFTGFGKKKRLQSAWSLAGAQLFNSHCSLNEAIEGLEKKKIKYDVVPVGVLLPREVRHREDLRAKYQEKQKQEEEQRLKELEELRTGNCIECGSPDCFNGDELCFSCGDGLPF